MDMLCAAANKLGSEGAKALNPSLSESPSKLSHQASTTCLRGTGKAGLSVLAPVLPSLFPKAHCTSKSHTPCMLQLKLMFQKKTNDWENGGGKRPEQGRGVYILHQPGD